MRDNRDERNTLKLFVGFARMDKESRAPGLK